MIVLFILFGLAIGSFLNVVILRLPEGESVAFPASHCPKCGKDLKFYHNIPLLSWIFLGGKCAYCKEKISIQYPLVEAFCGILFAVAFIKEGGDLFNSAIYGLVFSLLFALSVIDLRYKAVPDLLSIPTMALALFTNPPLDALNYALLFAGGFSLLRILVSFFLKKEAMGEADIIIAAIIGSMLGGELGLLAIYLGAVFALPAFMVVGKKGFELPFIPFLVLGLFITYLFDVPLLEWVKSFYA